ncbi:hypothetical protein SFRURICE_015839 [Spodoptera frugiperda]|nr:hypothetical protein SFRURICE_015839 [Spodoptera frugiperda]
MSWMLFLVPSRLRDTIWSHLLSDLYKSSLAAATSSSLKFVAQIWMADTSSITSSFCCKNASSSLAMSV